MVFFLVLTHAYPTEHHGKADVTLFGRCALTPRTVGVQQIFYHALSFARLARGNWVERGSKWWKIKGVSGLRSDEAVL